MPLTELILTENVPGLGAEAGAQLVFQVKSAEEPRERGGEVESAATYEPEKKKKHRFFHRRKEEKKDTT
jgi:hypothetical protein